MPFAPAKPCVRSGCRSLAVDGGRYCKKHTEAEKKQTKRYDKQRGSSCKRGYDRKWQKYRKRYLAVHPVCVRCEKMGRITPATVVDHIEPHRGDYDLFWDLGNHQAMCKRCHDIKTATEDGGFGRTVVG